jgi:uncharacterized protein
VCVAGKGGGQKTWSNVRKGLFFIAGALSLVVGIVGAFLPVLPTTPFILLAAYCFLRSSERLYLRLMNSRLAGKHVRAVLAGEGIPLGVKISSVAFSGVMIAYVSLALTESIIVRSALGLLFLIQVYSMSKIRTAGRGHATRNADSAETISREQ